MKVRLVSHASVIVSTEDCRIWTDPWLAGGAFNNSWKLHPPPVWDPRWLSEISHLWISHEHPDHFHLPTLDGLPRDFRERVTVLFQVTWSNKMVEAFAKLGFKSVTLLPHRERVPLTARTTAYCYQVGQMDSALAVIEAGQTLLNLNDCEPTAADCAALKKALGPPRVVLNQFSIAGYAGDPDRERVLPAKAAAKLERLAENHRRLGAQATIPFASFAYYSTADNRFMNAYANRPRKVAEHMRRQGLRLDVLFPGDEWDSAQDWSSEEALARHEAAWKDESALSFDPPKKVEVRELEQALKSCSEAWRRRFPALLLDRLRPVLIEVPDLGKVLRLSFAAASLEECPSGTAPDLTVHSQPLHFALRFAWGIQTLGVSARMTVHRNAANWRVHRILSALHNAELSLSVNELFSARMGKLLFSRSRTLLSQVAQRLVIRST